MSQDEKEQEIAQRFVELQSAIARVENRLAALEAAKPKPLDWPTLEPERLEKP